jgi:Fe-S oxidoreductase
VNAPAGAEAAVGRFVADIGARAAAYLEACVHCGQCAEACHFHEATGDARYTPAYKLKPLSKAYRRHKAPFAGLRRALGLAPAEVTTQELAEWQELLYDSCTLCGRCTVVCPMGIDIASLVALARRGMVAAGLGPADLLAAAERSKAEGSPLGLTPAKLADRLAWIADEYEVEIPLDRERAELLLTISSIETMKYPGSVAAMAKILNHAGESWTLSSKGYEATNFGVLSGRGDVARAMAERVAAAAEAVGARRVIVPECGHAYGALRWAGANLIGRPLPFAVLHITEYLAALVREGRLRLKPLARPLTYHDPCQVSRRGGATGAAREVLAAFAADFREMRPTGNANWCCGGGGGVAAIAAAAGLRRRVFGIKVRQVEATGAGTVVSSCSNCRLTLDEGKAAAGWDREIGSLVELVAEQLAA